MSDSMYTIVAGNICTGKTTVIKCLASRNACLLCLPEIYEGFLARYYEHAGEFAFHNQLSFAVQFLEQAVLIGNARGNVAQERSIYESHEIFSRLNFERGNITGEEFSLLERLVGIASKLARPDLFIMLQAPVRCLYERLQRRGAEGDGAIGEAMLTELQGRFAIWYEQFNLCRKVRIWTGGETIDSVVEAVGVAMRDGAGSRY